MAAKYAALKKQGGLEDHPRTRPLSKAREIPANEPEFTQLLVVDDDPAVTLLTKRILERQGYIVSIAQDAVEAREWLEERFFHLVLSDINMPGESGLNLVAGIKQDYPDTAIVMVSGIDDRKTAGRTLDLGVYGYIIKPFEPNEILINVANALRRRDLEIAGRDYRRRLEKEVILILSSSTFSSALEKK